MWSWDSILLLFLTSFLLNTAQRWRFVIFSDFCVSVIFAHQFLRHFTTMRSFAVLTMWRRSFWRYVLFIFPFSLVRSLDPPPPAECSDTVFFVLFFLFAFLRSSLPSTGPFSQHCIRIFSASLSSDAAGCNNSFIRNEDHHHTSSMSLSHVFTLGSSPIHSHARSLDITRLNGLEFCFTLLFKLLRTFHPSAPSPSPTLLFFGWRTLLVFLSCPRNSGKPLMNASILLIIRLSLPHR